MHTLFGGRYLRRRVFVTGHTGFKGSWLTLWLASLGAEVCGFALEPPTRPSHCALLAPPARDLRGDVCDAAVLRDAVAAFEPEIVFHLAAQPLVGEAFRRPADTFVTNALGTVNLLEACRASASVRAVVVVTSDKCYRNREWVWGYREEDALGGSDPYSASKACAELITASYRASFAAGDGNGAPRLHIASVRAGNVIGGGDWAAGRLVPDLMRDAAAGRPTELRHPQAVRPWQHVLEPLAGYLVLGTVLLDGDPQGEGAWNFGPGDESHLTVSGVVRELQRHWPQVRVSLPDGPAAFHEQQLLRLDSSKARALLGWRPVWSPAETLARTAVWYETYYRTGRAVSREQVADYARRARDRQLPGASDRRRAA